MRRALLQSAFGLLTFVALANCGSRTGLFGPDALDVDELPPDASRDVDVADGSRDSSANDARVVRDATLDVIADAALDVIEEPIPCVPGKFPLTLATPQLLFVLDRSGSMDYRLTSNTPAPPGTPSRWTTLRDSLSQTITPFSNQIAMGARFFPAVNADGFDPVQACIQDPVGTAIAPALGNANRIIGVFDQTSPIGGTPTAVALDLAARQLSVNRAVARAMVIATDGAPNCNSAIDGATCTCTSSSPTACGPGDNVNCLDDTRTFGTIADIFRNRGIPVYVVGIGVTSSFGSTLDTMAELGGRPRPGTPKYYAADTPAEMTAAFTEVRDSVSRCSYITPSAPNLNDPDSIAVVINGDTFLRDPTHTNGWDWIDQAYGHLQLFGSACTAASPTNVSGTVACVNDH